MLPKGGSFVTQQNIAAAPSTSPSLNASTSASSIYIVPGIGAHAKVPEYILVPIMDPSTTVKNVAVPGSHLPFGTSISPANICFIPSTGNQAEATEHELTPTKGPFITNMYFTGRPGSCVSFNTSTAAENICSMPSIGTQVEVAECKQVPVMGPSTITRHATALAHHACISTDHGSGTHRDDETPECSGSGISSAKGN